jgi:hypothetical protein
MEFGSNGNNGVVMGPEVIMYYETVHVMVKREHIVVCLAWNSSLWLLSFRLCCHGAADSAVTVLGKTLPSRCWVKRCWGLDSASRCWVKSMGCSSISSSQTQGMSQGLQPNGSGCLAGSIWMGV